MNRVTLQVKRLPHCQGLPQYGTEKSAGLDLRVAIDKPYTIQPGERAKLPTGIILGIPEGYYGQVIPRSGLSIRVGLTVVNSPGCIDEDYVEESQFLMINHGNEPYTIQPGERLAQLLILPVPRVEIVEVDEIKPSATRRGGFGSTGKLDIERAGKETTITINKREGMLSLDTVREILASPAVGERCSVHGDGCPLDEFRESCGYEALETENEDQA
jgi:dUTP pyrophosphatase